MQGTGNLNQACGYFNEMHFHVEFQSGDVNRCQLVATLYVAIAWLDTRAQMDLLEKLFTSKQI